ncbi:MAG: glutamate racemase [Sutterellaceae bacterium]|nr:glutamate racemase [Sutterellaceae bacterium]
MISLAYDWRDPTLPIGALDSGLGGLSVLREVRMALPREDLLFACDCGKAPWGDRSQGWIVERVRKIAAFLVSKRVKAITVACNTATAAAIEVLRSELPFPIIGIEPAVKPAARLTRNGTIGILATTGTISSPRLQGLIDRYGKGCNILRMACPGLMNRVEAGDFNSPETREVLHQFIDPLIREGADTLVLGCTHYPFLAEEIRQIAGSSVTVIDPSRAVAHFLVERLEEEGLIRGIRGETPVERFWCTGETAQKTAVLRHLWNDRAEMESLDEAWPSLSAQA